MSLYFIYNLLACDIPQSVFYSPHFWIAVIWLVYWSSLVFFWAFIKILYNNHWEHMQTAVYIQVIIATLTYLSMGTTLFFYPKKQTVENV